MTRTRICIGPEFSAPHTLSGNQRFPRDLRAADDNPTGCPTVKAMATRTHTHFWNDDDLTPLLSEAQKLRADYEHRIADNQFMPTELKVAAKDRIDNLDIAIRLLGDKAD